MCSALSSTVLEWVFMGASAMNSQGRAPSGPSKVVRVLKTQTVDEE